jgi:hypothetical protein
MLLNAMPVLPGQIREMMHAHFTDQLESLTKFLLIKWFN